MANSKNNAINTWGFRKILITGSLVVTICLALLFAGIKIWINYDANSFANDAVAVFQKDKIESLVALIDSDNYSLKEKNKAVWAFGILKDERALTKLESLYTGEDCNHETLICQYEVKKAIAKIEGGFKGSWPVSH